MIIFPAIDIINGHVVRLYQGKFDEITQYSQDPLDMAKQWAQEGAQWLHIVDLDGAKEGKRCNSDIIIKIARTLKIPVQTGGGIRTLDDVKILLDGGIKRIIVGTKAIEDRKLLKAILSTYPDNVAVSLDCHQGMVAQRGWTSTSKIKATDIARELEGLGLKYLIYTDISRDGTLNGPNIEELNDIVAASKIPVIASGGVSSLKDIKALMPLKNKGLIGVITGKALYEGKLDLKSAIAEAANG